MNDNDKLYIVRLQGLQGFEIKYGNSYVIAESPNEAYDKVYSFVEKHNLGVKAEREMDCIELVAEDTRYPDCKSILFT